MFTVNQILGWVHSDNDHRPTKTAKPRSSACKSTVISWTFCYGKDSGGGGFFRSSIFDSINTDVAADDVGGGGDANIDNKENGGGGGEIEGNPC